MLWWRAACAGPHHKVLGLHHRSYRGVNADAGTGSPCVGTAPARRRHSPRHSPRHGAGTAPAQRQHSASTAPAQRQHSARRRCRRALQARRPGRSVARVGRSQRGTAGLGRTPGAAPGARSTGRRHPSAAPHAATVDGSAPYRRRPVGRKGHNPVNCRGRPVESRRSPVDTGDDGGEPRRATAPPSRVVTGAPWRDCGAWWTAQAWSTASTSNSIFTFLPTSTPPASSTAFQVRPNSSRSISVLPSKAIRLPPQGSLAAPS